jgi:LPS export ABC transporter protein LptC
MTSSPKDAENLPRNLSAQRLATGFLLLGLFLILGEIVLLVPSQVDHSEMVGRSEAVYSGALTGIGDSSYDPKAQADQIISGFEYYSSQGSVRQWYLEAEKARLFEDQQRVDASIAHVKIFREEGGPYELWADRVVFKTNSRNLELIGNVLIEGEWPYRLETERALYNQEEQHLFIPGEVRVEGVADIPQMSLTGRSFITDLRAQEFTFEEGVHMIHRQENVQGLPLVLEIRAEQARGFRAMQMIEFRKDVEVLRDGSLSKMTLQSRQGKFYYEELRKGLKAAPEENRPIKKLKYMVVSDDVVMKERFKSPSGKSRGALRRASCERAEFFVRRNKVLMSGDPMLIQGKDQLRGKRIAFFLGDDLVEVDEAEAEVFLDGGQG